MTSLLLAGATCLFCYLLLQFIRMLRRGTTLKTDTWICIAESSPIRILFPSWTNIPGVVHGFCHPFEVNYKDFQRIGKDGYIEVSMTDPTNCVVFLADPQAYKEILKSRAPFTANVKSNKKFVGLFGSNLLTLEGDEWKHQRKIAQRAFTEKTLQPVWTETTLALEQLFERWNLEQGKQVSISQIADMTKMLTLMVISSSALGHRLSWVEGHDEPLSGFTMSFQKALDIVSRNLATRVLTPKWAEGLTEKTRITSIAYSEFEMYIRQMMKAYRTGGGLTHHASKKELGPMQSFENIFGVLMAASEQDSMEHGKGLTDESVIGNMFLFLFAGHETTANALAFSLGLLALYPQIQNDVYAQIKLVLCSRSRLEYADIGELKLVLGTFLESLRMYPVASHNIRIAEEDSILSIACNASSANKDSRENLVVPAGSYIFTSFVAMHYNPTYWPEPHEFRPSRFTGSYNKDAFVPFSTGRRVCIGQKFAETEATAALAMLLAQYEVSVNATKFAEIPGESDTARRKRLLKSEHFLTLIPQHLPLVFTRRA